ncbi:hypothetical protein ACQZV8_06550 [Magnetococcales bacterium HHB-1]
MAEEEKPNASRKVLKIGDKMHGACPACGKLIFFSANRCYHCGSKIEGNIPLVCYNCGASVDDNPEHLESQVAVEGAEIRKPGAKKGQAQNKLRQLFTKKAASPGETGQMAQWLSTPDAKKLLIFALLLATMGGIFFYHSQNDDICQKTDEAAQMMNAFKKGDPKKIAELKKKKGIKRCKRR